ncbi:hypothetical protein KIF59_09005 [Enterobacter cloacae subsp. cloacae]|nr:hypothetical protein [Enterobacter cloacae subsp. cloacae]
MSIQWCFPPCVKWATTLPFDDRQLRGAGSAGGRTSGYAQINTADAERLGIEDEALVWVNSRKGRIITRAQDQRSSQQRGRCT